MLKLSPLLVVQTSERVDLVAVVEEIKSTLFWVRVFPVDQSQARKITFAKKVHHGDYGISYLLNDTLVAYVTTYSEAPNADYHRTLAAQWEEYLSNARNREAFETYLAYERKAI